MRLYLLYRVRSLDFRRDIGFLSTVPGSALGRSVGGNGTQATERSLPLHAHILQLPVQQTCLYIRGVYEANGGI